MCINSFYSKTKSVNVSVLKISLLQMRNHERQRGNLPKLYSGSLTPHYHPQRTADLVDSSMLPKFQQSN